MNYLAGDHDVNASAHLKSVCVRMYVHRTEMRTYILSARRSTSCAEQKFPGPDADEDRRQKKKRANNVWLPPEFSFSLLSALCGIFS